MIRVLKPLAVLVALALALTACGDADDDSAEPSATTEASSPAEAPTTTGASSPTEAPTTTGAEADGVIDADRCATNEAAGTITYASPFDFAASTSILEVMVAIDRGYFDEVCLEVEFAPGFAPGNSALVAAGRAQFGGSGCFGELVGLNLNGEADLVGIMQFGHTAIAGLVVPADAGIEDLAADLPGRTMGIKGDIPCDLKIMLAELGIERGSFTELLLDGFDPVAHLALGIDALPVYKSNEPRTLDAEGIDYTLYDPLDLGVDASFGMITTSRSYLESNRTVVEDFTRAVLKAHEWAVTNPDEAVDTVFSFIEVAGGSNLIQFEETERYRWATEAAIVAESTPEGLPIGGIELEALGREVETLTSIGTYGTDEVPDWEPMVDPTVVEAVTDADGVIWD